MAKRKKSWNSSATFATGNSMEKIIMLFFTMSFLGNICEMSLVFAQTGHWVSRQGLIYGPFNAYYGVAAVLCMLLLSRLQGYNAAMVFVISAIVGSAYQWFASWAQELVFDSRSWNVSASPLNINGRTNLFFFICWGIVGLIFINHFYPWFSSLISSTPPVIGRVVMIIITVFMLLNIVISTSAVIRWAERADDANSKPETFIGSFVDKYYSGDYLSKIYTNLKFI